MKLYRGMRMVEVKVIKNNGEEREMGDKGEHDRKSGNESEGKNDLQVDSVLISIL